MTRCLFLAVLMWLLAPACGAENLAAGGHLPVLCYHQLDPQARSDMETTPALFAQQMEYLRKNGYHPVTLAQAGEYLEGRRQGLPPRPVLITFDDGYDGVYRYAFPILQHYRYPCAVFLVVGHVGRHPAPTRHLSWGQVEKMHRSGLVEFGSHTYDLHLPIPEWLAAGRLSRWRLQRDLVRSREVLHKRLKAEVRALAWPYGHYDEVSVEVARKAGFRMLFTTDYGPNLPGSGLLAIRRVRLSSSYDTVQVLAEKLQGND